MSYVGIPFSRLHCWGLVALVYADHGVELPSYGEIGAKELLAIAHTVSRESAGEPWQPATEPYRKLDVVVMKRLSETGKAPVHVGVMLDARRMLHVTEAAASHIIRLGNPRLPFKVLSVHRHKAFV